MSWIENNPRFQAWAATDAVTTSDRGVTGRDYADDGGYAVHFNDTNRHFSLTVFAPDWKDNPDGAGQRASEWFGQLFSPTPKQPADSELVWGAGW